MNLSPVGSCHQSVAGLCQATNHKKIKHACHPAYIINKHFNLWKKIVSVNCDLNFKHKNCVSNFSQNHAALRSYQAVNVSTFRHTAQLHWSHTWKHTCLHDRVPRITHSSSCIHVLFFFPPYKSTADVSLIFCVPFHPSLCVCGRVWECEHMSMPCCQ